MIGVPRMFVASWQTLAVVGINNMLSTCGHFANGFLVCLYLVGFSTLFTQHVGPLFMSSQSVV
jgi:hypothetical protein